MSSNTLLLAATAEAVGAAVDILKSGDVAALPTETVYGLAASCESEKGIKRIFEVKNRPADNPLILHCDGVEMAQKYVNATQDFLTLARLFWPGPLTIVAKHVGNVPSCVTAGQDTVALRVPDSSFFRDVITGLGCAVAAPSANISTRPSPTSAQQVMAQLNGLVPLVVDGGECNIGVESSIIFLGEQTVLLRPGDISKADLERALGREIKTHTDHATPKAPGMRYRHYAPTCEVVLYCGENFSGFLQRRQGSFGAVCYSEEMDCAKYCTCIDIGAKQDEKGQQRRLFSVLSSLDAYHLQTFYIHTQKAHTAIYNRLYKAAQGKVVIQ